MPDVLNDIPTGVETKKQESSDVMDDKAILNKLIEDYTLAEGIEAIERSGKRIKGWLTQKMLLTSFNSTDSEMIAVTERIKLTLSMLKLIRKTYI